jgi:lipopolysaccharide export LptBFGC system permease protein LptF
MRFGFDYSLNKSIDTDTGDHFSSLNKISDNIKELEDITQSLGDYDKTERQKYFFYRTGDLNIVAKYFGYNYDYGYDVEEEDDNIVESEVFAQSGVSYKRNAGIYYEKETSTFKDSKTDHDEYTVKVGTITAEGMEDELEQGNLRFSAFAEKNVVNESSLESNEGT